MFPAVRVSVGTNTQRESELALLKRLLKGALEASGPRVQFSPFHFTGYLTLSFLSLIFLICTLGIVVSCAHGVES